MDITKDFIKLKQPCSDGYRWYLRHAPPHGTYQQILDALVADGRAKDACWLLDQFGPTDTVLELDHLDAQDFIFAGSIEVRGDIEVSGTLRAGRGIRAGGGIKVHERLQAGDDVHCGAALFCAEGIEVKGRLYAAWNIIANGDIDCEELRAGWDLTCTGAVRINGNAQVGQELNVEKIQCEKGIRVGGDIISNADIVTRQGIECGRSLQCGGHLFSGWGIKALESISASGAISAGESLYSDGEICAGEGYGIYAGLNVPEHAWESSASVHAKKRPQSLRSGHWMNTQRAHDEG
jgi:cytoskeletal protein CcmA (bactofilin family)